MSYKRNMDYKDVLNIGGSELVKLKGHTINVVEICKPPNIEYAIHLAKVVSKLSPLIANMIEFFLENELNRIDWKGYGVWTRQDPDFPDLLFKGSLQPKPGFEIKTWFPLATEITARFKDSISAFNDDQTYICIVAWLPEFILYGKPKVIDVWIGSAKSLAIARDLHYHNPPDYLIFEPEDTSSRTKNLQQSNTNGYKFQDSASKFEEARKEVEGWGETGTIYQHKKEYQDKLKSLLRKYSYRLDTNFAKLDRIEHEDLEKFKSRILGTSISGHTIIEWSKVITNDENAIKKLIEDII
jgi:hypothetical protein